MSSPSGFGSRRSRYSRSPSGGAAPPSKRSKPSSSADGGHGSDQNRPYTSICVKNINPKIPDLEVRELCNRKFSKYGTNSVKIFYKNQERVAFVNFTSCDDAKRARHAKTGLLWENMQVALEPVYYRRTVPADQPLNPSSPRGRSPPSPRRRVRRSSPSPPPVSSRSHSSRHQRDSPPPRSRRHYSPYIPLPPDLADYATSKSSRRQSDPSVSPVRSKDHRRRSRSRSPKNRSKTDDSRADSNVQHEPTRTLFVGNLEREIRESKLREMFGRYGTIEEIDLKVPQSSSKRAYAFIQYENMDMAYEARRAMDGHFIGKADCKIGYGKIVPTNCLWVGNIPMNVKRRDLEQAFSRYGDFKSFDYATGDPAAIVTYNEIEDAIKARAKLTGVTQITDGRKVRSESGHSDSSRRAGFRIDYLDRPTARRFVIVRPQDTTSKRRSSSVSSSPKARARSLTPDEHPEKDNDDELKGVSSVSRSPSPVPVSKRRSPSPPTAGRSFHGPMGSYISPDDTSEINNTEELISLCEKLNEHSPAVYPVEFILKSHAYPARMHFLAGNPTLTNQILGQPGGQTSEKTELKLTQRLRLDQHKLDELEKKLRASVSSAATASSRKTSLANQTRFSILITSTKTPEAHRQSNGNRDSPREETDEAALSRFISYLAAKEAAGVISIPFHPNPSDDQDNSGESETAVLHIFPSCQFSKKILRMICPSIEFSNGPQTPPSRPTAMLNDEHLMVVIFHNE